MSNRVQKNNDELVNNNLKGVELEKQGKVDQAIILYEKNIKERFDGNHPYDRLSKIYRERKLINDEIRVLKIAIDVFENDVNPARKDRLPKINRFKTRLKKALTLI